MDTAPKNTVGTQITGEQSDDIPDEMPVAVPTAAPEVIHPSEVDRPHEQDADHLIPQNLHPRPMGKPVGGEGAGWPSEMERREKPSGTSPRTGIGRGE